MIKSHWKDRLHKQVSARHKKHKLYNHHNIHIEDTIDIKKKELLTTLL